VTDEENFEVTVANILGAAHEDEEVPEPEVSATERRQRGDLAGMVKLLRDAAAAARAAHSLAVQHRRAHPVIEGDEINRVQLEALDQAIEDTWKAEAQTRLAFRDVAAVPPALFRH